MSRASRIATIAQQEFRLARRNRWVGLATGALALFALALGFAGAGQGAALKADPLSLTAASLATLSVYLIPLIALLISYDTIAGEMERGTLALTLATPAGRGELMVGKFLALCAVLAVSMLIGFGIAGGAVAARYGFAAEGLAAWGRLLGSALALGAVFVALGLTLSALAGRTGTAAALVVGLWLLAVVLYDLALLGALIADGGGVFTKQVFPVLVLANPADAFRLYNLVSLAAAPVAGIDGLARTLPFPPEATLAVIALWLAAALGAGFAAMRRLQP
jgi:Cu-processing system permease protein